MTTVLLALAAGALFGLLIALARWALGRGADAEAGAAWTATIATVVVVVIAVAAGELSGGSWSSLWPYVVIGAFAPGAAQLFFIHAVRAAGPSRTGIVIGVTPVLSAFIAIVALDERPHAVLGLGTALIVLGGLTLAWEKTRPVDFRAIGLLLAAACAVLFATRDNVYRGLTGEDAPPVLLATVVSVAAAAVVTIVWLVIRQRREMSRTLVAAAVPFAPAGLALGGAYVALLAALERGEVTLVSPLNATQSLWGILFAAVFVGRREDAIGRRLVVAAAFVVAGGALVAAFR